MRAWVRATVQVVPVKAAPPQEVAPIWYSVTRNAGFGPRRWTWVLPATKVVPGTAGSSTVTLSRVAAVLLRRVTV